jgi:hypothetical protein
MTNRHGRREKKKSEKAIVDNAWPVAGGYESRDIPNGLKVVVLIEENHDKCYEFRDWIGTRSRRVWLAGKRGSSTKNGKMKVIECEDRWIYTENGEMNAS